MRGGLLGRKVLRTALPAVLTAVFAAPATAQSPGPGYEIVSNGPVLELRFHGIPLKSVHADDAQSALSLDFSTPVDGAVFDNLNSALPQWIGMAYSNYDNGVIRASRPVTFLTRSETDGFSLRIVPREGVAAAPAPPPGLRGGYAGDAPQPYPQAPPPGYPQPGYPPQAYPQQPGYPPPVPMGGPPIPLAPPQNTSAARNYYGLQYAVHRADPLWANAYDHAGVTGDSRLSLGTEYHRYHNGDAVIASRISARVSAGGGLSLIGSLADINTKSDLVRASNGAFIANSRTNDIAGSAGFAFNMLGNTELSLEGLVGNNVGGGRLGLHSSNPDGFFAATLAYHLPYQDTPEAVLSDAFKDEAVLATSQRLGYGLWGYVAGRFDNYGVHGQASAVRTAGWDAGLRWDADVGGLSAGLAYDGHGEYRFDNITLAGAAPTPYIPLSIRNMETHALTASLSSMALGNGLWFDLFGGYVYDRYATDGAQYGVSMRYRPTPGIDLEIGARHATVSRMQGEIGAESSVGLNLTIGFGGPLRLL